MVVGKDVYSNFNMLTDFPPAVVGLFNDAVTKDDTAIFFQLENSH